MKKGYQFAYGNFLCSYVQYGGLCGLSRSSTSCGRMSVLRKQWLERDKSRP